MTETDVRPGTSEALDTELDDESDDNRFSHYVKRDDVLRSAVEGVPATALCGKKWFPGRDPEKYPVCPVCKELVEMAEQL